jgi:hypothetical protein
MHWHMHIYAIARGVAPLLACLLACHDHGDAMYVTVYEEFARREFRVRALALGTWSRHDHGRVVNVNAQSCTWHTERVTGIPVPPLFVSRNLSFLTYFLPGSR